MADRGTDMVSDRTGLGVVWCLSLPDLRVISECIKNRPKQPPNAYFSFSFCLCLYLSN
jgi:hypothetical protein